VTTYTDHLRAVLADPQDDGPRLILADWLTDHGEPERGEFIRVQCELARLLEEQKKCSGTLRAVGMGVHIDPLSRRADELLAEHWIDWAPLPLLTLSGYTNENHDGTDDWEYRRGFVAEVTLTAEAWLGGRCLNCAASGWLPSDGAPTTRCPICTDGRLPGHADALVAATPLEVVRLTTMPQEVTAPLISPGIGADWSEIVLASLSQRWPAIRFELPPGGYPMPEGVTPEMMMADSGEPPFPYERDARGRFVRRIPLEERMPRR